MLCVHLYVHALGDMKELSMEQVYCREVRIYLHNILIACEWVWAWLWVRVHISISTAPNSWCVRWAGMHVLWHRFARVRALRASESLDVSVSVSVSVPPDWIRVGGILRGREACVKGRLCLCMYVLARARVAMPVGVCRCPL